MEFRHLRSFLAVAETLNFRQAAEHVHVTQSALSRQIQRLEDTLGVTLFDRSHRAVALTAAGRAFVPEARQTLARAEQAQRTVRRAARGEVGRLVVGFVGPAIYGVLPGILRAFRAAAPDVELVLREMRTDAQRAALRDGTLDVAFAGLGPDGAAIRSEPVDREAVMIALPAEHRLAGAEAVDLVDLAEDPFIIFERPFEPELFDALIGLCQRAGFSPQIAQQANRIFVILGLVSAGLGVAFAPGSVRRGLSTQEVVFAPLRDATPTPALCMAWRADNDSPVLAAFLGAARSTVRAG
ncbi:MAG: LysR family transcriptional regulator [Bacteroidetes bacterium]|jgi:DNA-binding transcriptional LysR family regulator|nr:LysR family transcriptional regulator [Bacteroidota bacterium]